MAFLGALFFGFVPMFLYAAFINWLDRYEKEAKVLLRAGFVWGLVVAAGGAVINGLDRYEKEPKLLLGAAFVWGMVIAAGGAFILNTAFGIGIYALTGSEGAAEFGTTSIVAPIIEEGLKGLAVLVVFLI